MGLIHYSEDDIREFMVGDILDRLRDGAWSDEVSQVRSERSSDRRSLLKASLPMISYGPDYVCLDVGRYSDRSILERDKYSYAVMTTVGGYGLAVLVRINPEKLAASFNWLAHYYFDNYGISIDRRSQYADHRQYVTHDASLYVNKKAHRSRTKVMAPWRKLKRHISVHNEEAVGMMVEKAVNMGKVLVPGYEQFRLLGKSLAGGFSEGGRQWFSDLCEVSLGDRFNPYQVGDFYDACLVSRNKLDVGVFYGMLRGVGITMPTTNDRIVAVAVMGRQKGWTEEATINYLAKVDGVDPVRAGEVVGEVYADVEVSLEDLAKDPLTLNSSLKVWLDVFHRIRRDEVSGKYFEDGYGEFKEERFNTVYLRAQMAFNSRNVTKDLVASVLFSDMTEQFNPITDYMDRNRHRVLDGGLDRLVATVETDTLMADVFIRKWMVSIIAAWDGNPVRSVLAFTGKQLTGKTQWFRRLLPTELYERYYAESKLDHDKDSERLMCEKLIVMDDEMGGKSKSDAKRFKELTSKETFSLRPPYGKNNIDIKRLAILCGTSNDPNVINDQTGNTRILPVNVMSIDHAAYNAIDKDELFMECYRLYTGGFEWELTREEMAHLAEVGEEFEAGCLEKDLLEKYFHPADEDSTVGEWMRKAEMYVYVSQQTGLRLVEHKFNYAVGELFPKEARRKMRLNGSAPAWRYWVERIDQSEEGPPPVRYEKEEASEVPF